MQTYELEMVVFLLALLRVALPATILFAAGAIVGKIDRSAGRRVV